MSTILSAVINWVLSFFTGKLLGRKSSEQKAAERAVEDYRDGEKIDAQPDLNGDSLRAWYKRMHNK